MNLFLDSNALIKLYHEENGTETLKNFLEMNADELTITISDLTRIEFYSAFLRRVRTCEIELSVVHGIFNDFEGDMKAFHIVEVESAVKMLAVHLLTFYSHERSLRTLDALQLSTAILSRQYVAIDYFVSSDTKLIYIAKDFFTILDVER
ncbi:MAG: type II toxin-antitoxin system VapC family toxin [Desulfobacterales bacterium]